MYVHECDTLSHHFTCTRKCIKTIITKLSVHVGGGYSNHPMSVCYQRLQDIVIQTSFLWIEWDVKGMNYKYFVVKMYHLELLTSTEK